MDLHTAELRGFTLEYRSMGSGAPVITVHGALLADTFHPLMAEPQLTSRHQLITYRRRGYGGSTPTVGPIRIERQAADCLALLDHLGIDRAHIVGHSYGGDVALQLALDAPEVVHTLALLEPAFFSPAAAEGYRLALNRGQQRYHEAGAAIVIDEFFTPRFGSGYRAMLEHQLPGGFAQAVADARTFFEDEIPELTKWHFGDAELKRVKHPVLMVLGERSNDLWPRFGETHEQLLSELPRAEGYVLPNASHALQVENPGELAGALVDFWARHSD